MAITKEQLISAGIEEEVATKILTPVNKLFKDTLDNNYVSKEVFNTTNTKKNEFEQQLIAANNEVTRLKPFEEQAATLQATVTDLNTKLSQLQTKYDNQAIVLGNENTVKNIISNMVYDIDDVFPKIDMSKIVFEDGKVKSGLDEQLQVLKQNKPHHFKSTEQNNRAFGFNPRNSNNDPDGHKDSAAVAFAKSLAQQRVEVNKSIQNANEQYFKGGIN